MERKECIIPVVFFVTLFCVSYTVDLVAASKVSTKKTPKESEDLCAVYTEDIIGQTSNMNKTDHGSCQTIDVWVPKKEGFTEFVEVNEQSVVKGGFSIAIFCRALSLLTYNVTPIFKSFVNSEGKSNGTYDELIKKIQGQKCAAVVGDVTMRGERAQYVSFSIPYLNSDVYMLVRLTHELKQSLWTFFKPFTTRLWIALVSACFLTGVTLAFLEFREHNPEFSGPFYRQLVMVIWFPISTFFLQEGRRIRNKFSKVVLVMWLSMLFMVLQIFTATLSSWLTLDQLRPPLSTVETIGYQNGSFIKDLINDMYNSSMGVKPLLSVEEYKNALSSGDVDVIFDELPYIEVFLSQNGPEYIKYGPLKQEPGFAFAFPIESPILPQFSRAVLNVTESGIMMKMKEKYLGFSNPIKYPEPNHAHPQSLDVHSFIGLFVFMGIVIIAAIISSEIAIMQRKTKTLNGRSYTI